MVLASSVGCLLLSAAYSCGYSLCKLYDCSVWPVVKGSTRYSSLRCQIGVNLANDPSYRNLAIVCALTVALALSVAVAIYTYRRKCRTR